MNLTAHQALLAGYLGKHCRGHQRARTQRRITADLRTLGVEMTVREVRDLLAEMAMGSLPVGTDTHGAFLCVGRADFRRAYRNLYSRVREQAKRCRRFRRTFAEFTGGQLGFDFDDAERRYTDLQATPLLAACGSAGVGASEGGGAR